MKTKKSRRRLGILCAVAAVAALLCLPACAKSELERYDDSISELREHLFAAENADYKITAVSGRREDPYLFDGRSGVKRAFTVLTVTPTVYAPEKTYRYRVEVEGDVYEGDLLPHPFARSLSADIPATIERDFTLTVSAGGEATFAVKNSVAEELIAAEKALSIAFDKLKAELKRFKNKGRLQAEIYVRLMENPIDGSGGYFWYVAFVGEDKSTVAVLLRGDTGAVAALRV